MTKETDPKDIDLVQSIKIPIESVENNEGQIPGVKANPREMTEQEFRKLKKSLQRNPEFTAISELRLYPFDGKYIAIGGNMRFAAMRELGWTEVIGKPIPADTDADTLNRYILLDNANFGKWDFDKLANDWNNEMLADYNIDIPQISYGGEPDEAENGDDEDNTDENEDEEEFYRSMFNDVLFDSDNVYEIPNLLLDMQAGKVELPLTPWGANTRLSKDVATYHFYVDDYRFNALFKNPISLLTSGCKAVVEPNCSIHDQMPLAWGLQLIYKKRWLSRYLQECGIKVYADLNVSHKFTEYNNMGIPKGYNAFFTRGLDGWMESLKLDLKAAQEISGLERPNLVVYGGGKEIQSFCREKGLLYITDFINAKKER